MTSGQPSDEGAQEDRSPRVFDLAERTEQFADDVIARARVLWKEADELNRIFATIHRRSGDKDQ